MELGLSLGATMPPDAGRELVLELGVGREEEGKRGKREMEMGTTRCGSSPEPTVRLSLLPLVPSLGFRWPSSESRHLEASSRGLDVNQAPSSVGAWAYAEEEDAAVSSSPNNSAGALRRSCSRASDEDDSGSARKKLRLSKEQSAFLEESFKEHSTLNPKQKQALAKELNLRPRQVEVWFQNRRARTKLKQTEVDCQHLKRCCEALTEENRRLHKEVAELRALKTLSMHLPATTLSMCPCCERVASTAAPVDAASAAPAERRRAAERRPSSFAALFSSSPSVPPAAHPEAPSTS